MKVMKGFTPIKFIYYFNRTEKAANEEGKCKCVDVNRELNTEERKKT